MWGFQRIPARKLLIPMAIAAVLAHYSPSVRPLFSACTRSSFSRRLPRFQQVVPSEMLSQRVPSGVPVRSLATGFGKPLAPAHKFGCQLGAWLAAVTLRLAGSQTLSTSEMSGQVPRDSGRSSLVDVHWLHDHLKDENVKVLDASWYMPADQRNPLNEFKALHIPGSLFFDVDGVVDPTSNLPHMLPTEGAFAAAASALGLQNNDMIVVYDGKGIFSAARVWWMFRVFGHDNVTVLDGGLPQWRASCYELESNVSEDVLARVQAASEAVRKSYQGLQVDTSGFRATFQPQLVWSCEQVKENIKERKYQLVDARSKARFDGVAPEPRKGIRGGHVPGSLCVPFGDVLKDGRTLMVPEELEAKFQEAGVSLSDPVVASCGTGVTACVLALALHQLGKEAAVYDGSWTEWGGLSDTPISTNASTNQ
eukprot:c23090_g1_i1 orf=489-1757(-)